VHRIVRAVAAAAEEHAERLGHEAVKETGFGVAADKVTKNQMIVRGFMKEYGNDDYCGHRVDSVAKIVEVPKPAGVIFALTPSTAPVATAYFKVLAAMLTRNAIVISPHPAAANVTAEAARVLGEAATAAGAPRHAIQVLAKPTIPVVEALMGDERTKLVVATGGGAVVRAAYRSGTPALGVGPGNPPVVVDETADLAQAAAKIVNSKAFDNSVNCTAESVLFAVASIVGTLRGHLERNDAYICDEAETQKIRDYAYPGGNFNAKVVGRTALDVARGAGVRVPQGTRILVAPIDRIADDEPLTHEKLCPVLAMRVVPDFSEALHEADALVRIVGVGHSAVIHTTDPQRILDYATALPVHRIAVNTEGSLGNAGWTSNTPLTMSVGTGFIGGSSTADNVTPGHLVQWSRTTYAADSSEPFPDFTRLRARNLQSVTGADNLAGNLSDEQIRTFIRDDLRRIVLEELRDLIGTP
jgi:acyl-CoA reductase-like NAD-dependent aldehyde dehydrogenase